MIVCINRWKDAGELLSPKNMTFGLNSPLRVLKARPFSQKSSHFWFPQHVQILVKVVPPDSRPTECIYGSGRPTQNFIMLMLIYYIDVLVMLSRYHICDYKYYVYMVPAGHNKAGITSQYHNCDHIYYVLLVLAGHNVNDIIGQYHICDHKYYVLMVPAGHDRNDISSRYHICDHKYYVLIIPTDHDRKMI